MKNFFQVLGVFVVLTSFLFPQRVTDQVTISDGVGNSQILIFGLDSTATDGIDISLGEGLLPPFPPTGAFEARFFLPENSFSGTAASKKDFRFATFTIPYIGQKEFRLAYQPGAGSTQITVSWILQQNVTGLLQDIFGGVLINVPMALTGSYGVTPFGIDRLKMVINYNGVIPVELVSFTAFATGSSIKLDWATATETNNKGFEIQRKSENSDWDEIGFVEGSGTSTNRNEYTYTDKPSAGKYSYRLRQIDFDGSSNYSNVVNVDLNAPTEFKLNQNYPNPFNPSTTVSFTIPKASNVKLNIYNQIGQQVGELVNRNLEAGSYNYTWNAGNQSSGIYFYELQANEFKSVRKMTLIK